MVGEGATPEQEVDDNRARVLGMQAAIRAAQALVPSVIPILLLAPTTHFVALAQAILYRGAGFAIVWPQILALS